MIKTGYIYVVQISCKLSHPKIESLSSNIYSVFKYIVPTALLTIPTPSALQSRDREIRSRYPISIPPYLTIPVTGASTDLEMSARLCILRASRNGEVVRWYYSVLMLVCLAIVGFTLGCSHGPGSSFPARDMYRLVSLTGNVTEPADLKISTYAIAEEPVIRTLLVDVLPYVNKDIHVGAGSLPQKNMNADYYYRTFYRMFHT